MLLALDPGKSAGVAVFKNKTLHFVALIENPCTIAEVFGRFKITKMIVEIPRVYPMKHWKGDPNDLIKVAIGAGTMIGIGKQIRPRMRVTEVFPAQWKGQRPKDIDNAYTAGLLKKEEADVLAKLKVSASKKHNVIDAIGIGLWLLKRR